MANAPVTDAVRTWSTPFLTNIGLPYLPIHLSTVFRSLLLWWSLQLLSAGVSPKLFAKHVGKMSPHKRVQWDMHFVSLVHSSIVAPIALYVWLVTDETKTDMVFAYDFKVGQLYAFSLGYFLWDVIQSMRYEGFQFVVHGVFAAIASLLVYHPFLMFGGLPFLIWEASTPFLNIHWFLDKTGRTGSLAQLINSVFLIGSYIGIRLILGLYVSYQIISWVLLPSADLAHRIPMGFKLFYTSGILSLDFLNFFWFSKMIKAVQKRFVKEDKKQ